MSVSVPVLERLLQMRLVFQIVHGQPISGDAKWRCKVMHGDKVWPRAAMHAQDGEWRVGDEMVRHGVSCADIGPCLPCLRELT